MGALVLLIVALFVLGRRGKKPRSLKINGLATQTDGDVVVNASAEFADPTCGCVYRGQRDGTNKRVRWCSDCAAVEKRLRKMERR